MLTSSFIGWRSEPLWTDADGAAAVQPRMAGDHGRVKAEVGEGKRKARDLQPFVEIAEQGDNLLCRVHVLVAHDGAVRESPLQEVFDAGGGAPGEPPKHAAFARKSRAKRSALF